MRAPAWEGNWHERIQERIRGLGFRTVTAFVDSQPTASLVTLARQLGRGHDVAAIQLQKMLVAEAEEKGTVERCARSLLVRALHEELPEGWHRKWDDAPLGSGFRLASVYGSWVTALPSRYEESSDRVWDALEAAPIPEGWLPDGPDEPILVELFRQHWDAPE